MSNLSKFPKNDEYFKSDTLQGVFPKKWNVKKFKYLFKFNKGLTITKENLQDKGIPCVNYGEVHSKYGFEVNPDKHQLKCVSLEYVDKFSKSLLEFGDFVFADTSEDIEGSGNFTQLIADQVVFAGYHTVIARPIKNHHYRYLAYLFDSVAFRNQVRRLVKGVKVFTISQAILKNTFLWLPSNKEQIAIAKFLDEKTAKIDEAIAIKEKQIELLKERKQILIQNAVTRGLDPNVPMKDSGVDWIGEIPEHWDVIPLKHLLKEKLKYGANESGVAYDPELPRYIRITDFSDEGMLSEKSKLSLTWKMGGEYLLEDGDILFARSGATVGKCYQFKTTMSSEKHYAFAGYLIKATADKNKLLSDYLKYYSMSDCFTGWREVIFNKATIENIGADKYAHLPVVLPLIEEQVEIVNEIKAASEKYYYAINFQQQQIKKLKEYKSTLITSAVTGKIKVL